MTNLKEERMEILKMVAEGKITQEEALDLLDALEGSKVDISKSRTKTDSKWIRIKVNEGDGKTKVNVNLPIALLDIGLKIGTKFTSEIDDEVMKKIDFEEIMELIKSGANGKIVDIESAEDNTKVEIFVE